MQADNLPSGDWWISYADSAGKTPNVDGIKVLGFALLMAYERDRIWPVEKQSSDWALEEAINSLKLTEHDRIRGKQLAFSNIVFVVDDLWMYPKLVTFWTNKSEFSTPIANNILEGASDELRALFFTWFRRWRGGAVAPFLGGLTDESRQSPQFEEFTKWVARLCRPPRRGRLPGVRRKDGLADAVQFVADFMAFNPTASRRMVIRSILGLDGSEAMFKVVAQLPENSWEWSFCIQSSESGERDKGGLVAGDKAVRLIERHLSNLT